MIDNIIREMYTGNFSFYILIVNILQLYVAIVYNRRNKL